MAAAISSWGPLFPGRPPSGRTQVARIVAAVVVAVGAVLLSVWGPHDTPAVKMPAGGHLVPREPDVRVRIAVIEARQTVRLTSVGTRDGGRTTPTIDVTNQDGVPFVLGAALATPAVFAGADHAPIGLNDRHYAGDVIVDQEGNNSGRVVVINRVPLETYLEGVLLAEMPGSYADDALRAQAIASRSYAAWQTFVNRSRPFDVYDSQKSQVYKGESSKRRLARRIVDETRGQVLMFDGRLVEAVFSSTCGGTTRSAEEAFGQPSIPPLAGVVCGFCNNTQLASWSLDISAGEIGRAADLGGAVVDVTDLQSHASGRLAFVTLVGAQKNRKLSGEQLRELLGRGARSTWVTSLTVADGKIHARGRGFGHGVGMCQVGAGAFAEARADWQAILARYYPGATVRLLYPPHAS